jgi:peptide/nickel transport system permease protein
MVAYSLRRIASTLPVLAIVGLFVFSLLYILPGDPAALIAGDHASPEVIERIRHGLGLDRPFLLRLTEWYGQILHGDLGTSIFTNLPVSTMIGQRVGPTLSLLAVTLLFAVSVGVPIGVLAAWRAGSWIDRAVMALNAIGFAVPAFILGYALAYVFALRFGWLPVQGYSPMTEGFWPWIRHLVLPAAALGSLQIALITRITRAAMLDVLHQDYIRAARARGLPERKILFVHVLKNASLPIVTVAGSSVAVLIGGAVVTETVFAIPGIGRLIVDAILHRDYPTVQAVVLLSSFACVLINLLVDLIYPWLDPRIEQ